MEKKSVASIAFAIFGLCIIGFVGFKAYKESERNRQIGKEIGAIQAEAEKIRKSNRELEEKIAYFQTPEFQEKVAKEKLNFQKADEEVVIIKSSPSLKSDKEAGDEELAGAFREEDKTPNYQKWWKYFFKY
jgi:cell division protein FtsB